MAFGATSRQELQTSVLPKAEWNLYLNNSSDVAGFVQLFFHAGCAILAALVVHWALQTGSVSGLLLGELSLGFVSSFYFMGFHELIHNTAFRTKLINKVLAQVVGVFIFRGSNWFWSFHWLHHRYTSDPEKDPELSGGSADLMDPSRGVLMYLRFLTGWPFGFERAVHMVKMALGRSVDPWVEEAGMETKVQIESAAHVLIYAAFAVGAVLDAQVRTFVIWYWLLPHILGAGHLRYYQFAEHRACEQGHYTDLDAWGTTRTTSTWFLYRRLAWNMPYHIEHHAWPAVPFHLLPDVHERIKNNQPENRCLISGDSGYLAIHVDFLKRVIRGQPTNLPMVEPGQNGGGDVEAAVASNRLEDPDAMARLPRFTLAEVGKHTTSTDCWVVVNGIVMDVTSFLKDHPGGEPILLTKAGQDASKMFKMIHPERTLQTRLPDVCIVGVLAEPGTGLGEPLLNKANGQH